MDFVPPAKQRELRSALEKIESGIVVVHGPPGSSKTYSIERTAQGLGLSIEYIEDVGMYKSMLPIRNAICLTDMDDYEYLSRHRKRLEKMKNLVIETRTLFSIGKILPNATIVNFGKISSRKIQKFYNLNEKEALKVGENLHAVGFCKYGIRSETVSIFHLLGKLFHSKETDVPKAAEMINVYGRDRFIGYLIENCTSFMSIKDIHKLIDGISLEDIGEMHLEHLIWVVLSSVKVGPRRFFSFRSWKGAVLSEHTCSNLCMNR
ncbi:uncharacterized protein Eint_020950 [Encephalitozoon intestinalis ATCC 50506]|uniref:Uncharacterized protein n=1 Tax=Encephalitozoon intestinalis (strain ATCC 50506) TaxID=876142 RepID=E0S5V8_ENCIT|nr:uncharacterized protein Eint_020950 [Encephalitozoon intestinalis ATCC 50506]ADM11093.1 hypothetical protein Eint_020950 [Encephalitozoon intestinalis ATCC 50506]UTX44747.1 hypothetical protein GPK93_02g02650 [Encephalitozoon intestinalis]